MDDKAVTACVNILETMDGRYTVRPVFGSGLYRVLFGYGFEFSRESLPVIKKFFEDKTVTAKRWGGISLERCGEV